MILPTTFEKRSRSPKTITAGLTATDVFEFLARKADVSIYFDNNWGQSKIRMYDVYFVEAEVLDGKTILKMRANDGSQLGPFVRDSQRIHF